MRRTIIALAALAALCLGATPSVTAAAAPHGSITMRINCVPKYNSVQIFDDTDQELDLRTWTVTSLYRPGPDEPIALNGTVAPGGGATFFSGASKDRVLIGHDIFQSGQPGEGARLTTPYGTLDVLCTAGRGTLTLGTLPGLPNTGGGGVAQAPYAGAAPSAALALLVFAGGCLAGVRRRG
jgi:hypothetical protein